MTILTVNTGSSSCRLAAFVASEGRVSQEASDAFRIAEGHEEAAERVLRTFLREHRVGGIAAAAHRVVHGGRRLVKSRLLDAWAEEEIGRLSPLAPLHNPAALAWIRACRRILGPDVPQAAVFDTAFFADLPPVAAEYALPRDLCFRHAVRRFGFHGIAHRAMWERWRDVRPDLDGGGRLITLQLGSGCSITAVADGRPRDTSMGFSPLEGLVMDTRSGDVDPGLLTYLMKAEGWAPEDLEKVLNEESGLKGLSGIGRDMPRLLEASADRAGARLALDIYCYRARKYIGAYMAVLGGTDGITFGGGVGENAPAVRTKILSGMEWCGIDVDERANREAVGRDGRISPEGSAVEVRVVAVDETAVIARETLEVLSRARESSARETKEESK
jgi:acetate kinase